MFSKLVTVLTAGVVFFIIGAQSLADQYVYISDNPRIENSESSAIIPQKKEFDIITIYHEGYDRHRKGPVNFYHKRHARKYNITCWACHHEYADGKENIWSPWGTTDKCSNCHDPSEKKGGVIKLQTSFHLNCITCHQEMELYKGMRPSQTCGKCHVQEVIIKNEIYQEDKMGPVAFQHQKHIKTYPNPEGDNISCEECHHEYINGKNIWKEGDTIRKCGTSGCHDPIKNIGEKQVKLRTAYHTECKICHRDVAKADEKKNAPYIKCSGCHLSSR